MRNVHITEERKMRTIEKFELKEGENRIKVPSLAETVCAINWEAGTGYAVGVAMETETDDVEEVERAFLVVKLGDEIKERLVLAPVGHVYLPSGVVFVYEVL